MDKTNENLTKQSDNIINDENLEKATGGEFATDSKVIDRYKEEILEIYGSIKEKKRKN